MQWNYLKELIILYSRIFLPGSKIYSVDMVDISSKNYRFVH